MCPDNYNKIKETVDTFDKYSDRYEDWFSGEDGKIIKETEKRAARMLIPEGKGLEIGAGSGIFSSALGVNYGLDPAEELLRMASSRGIKTALGVAELLPFKKESFDFVLFMFTLSFLTDPSKAFREAREVLKPGGKLIVCFIPAESPWGKSYREKKTNGHDFYRHARFHSPERVEKFLDETGLKKMRSVSTLFQKPDSVEEVEDPIEGTYESAGLCCFEAKKS